MARIPHLSPIEIDALRAYARHSRDIARMVSLGGEALRAHTQLREHEQQLREAARWEELARLHRDMRTWQATGDYQAVREAIQRAADLGLADQLRSLDVPAFYRRRGVSPDFEAIAEDLDAKLQEAEASVDDDEERQDLAHARTWLRDLMAAAATAARNADAMTLINIAILLYNLWLGILQHREIEQLQEVSESLMRSAKTIQEYADNECGPEPED